MNFCDTVLDEFNGQLRLEDIYKMTYKELEYLRKHRAKIREAKAKNPSLGDLLGATK